MAALTGVHGIGMHHRGRHQLLSTWEPALADGLERAVGQRVERPELDLAFYGDLYLPDGGDRLKSGRGSLQPDLADLAEEELDEVSAWLSEAMDPQEDPAESAGGDKGYTRVPRPLQQLLRAFDRRFGAAAAVLYIGVLRQVRRYLTDTELKAAVDARVREAVADDCRVLVGHSLGSVVAYEYLRQNPGHGISTLVTVGSPLGLRMVRDRIAVHALDVPVWAAVRDLRDPVACAGPLRAWWPQIRGDDEPEVNNGGDAHAAERYLSRRATGGLVLRGLPGLVDG
jgi:hypothetical protein